MTWELKEEFQFNSDAKGICNSIVDNQSMRAIKLNDESIEFIGYLNARPSGREQGALFSITINVYIKEFIWADEYSEYLVKDNTIGEIVIIQNQPGICVAKLYYETDSLKWGQIESRPSTNWSAIVGVHFISLMWSQLVDECLEINNSAKQAELEKNVERMTKLVSESFSGITKNAALSETQAAKKKARQKKPRNDVKKRVALALFRCDTDYISRRDAAVKSGTTTDSINKYEKLLEVQSQLKEFKNKPFDARKFQQYITQIKAKRKENKEKNI